MQYLLMLCSLLFGDLTIKQHIEQDYRENEEKSICRGAFLIRKHHNRGIALNIGSHKQKVVAALSTVFTLFVSIFFLFTLGQKGNTLLKTGLSLILGGAYSNTYDRLKRKYVVDYVSFGVKWKWLRNIIFNIGDFGIMIGALMLVLAEAQK